MRFFANWFNKWSNDIGIDLGTANTLVYVLGHGIIIDEPSVVALNRKTSRAVAVGLEAKKMLGRNPGHIEVVRPLVDGVISDFEVTEEMLYYLINKAERLIKSRFRIRPRVVVGVPSGISNVEVRAVIDASKSGGAREVYIVEEPMAAAIGIGLPVNDPVGSMVIDIGGGTTDIAVISLGGVVKSKNVKIAGDHLNRDIINSIRREFKILIGEKTAEDMKIRLSSVKATDDRFEMNIRGRDLVTGLPREIIVTDIDVREAILPSVMQLIDAVKEILELTPPEIVSDVMRRGVYLTGGGALIRGLDRVIQEEMNIPVFVADDPLSAVARGAGRILEDLDLYAPVLMHENDELPPR